MDLLWNPFKEEVKAMHTLFFTKIQQEKIYQKSGQSRQSSQYIKEKQIHNTAKITEASAFRAFQGKSSPN